MIQAQLLGVFFLLFAVAQGLKVPVTVYYESLCPDSAKFITEQVYPAVKTELQEHIDVTWVPFGKSNYSTFGSEVTFHCHHGPNECYGNKVHSCAIEHIQANSYQTEHTRESLILEFVNCMMKIGKNFPDNVYPGAKCARDNHINTWENIQQCANSTEGSQLLKKHGETTNQFQSPLESVPTVVFKHQFDKNVNKDAFSNFLGTVCRYVSQPQPRICSSQNGAASVSFLYVPLLGVLGYFISSFF